MARPVRAICRGTCWWRWPGRALQNAHKSETTAKADACPLDGNLPTPSWPGLSGPPVAAQVLELMARTSRAITVEPRPQRIVPEICECGRDEPGHDGVATIVPPAPYFNAYAACAGHDDEGAPSTRSNLPAVRC